MPEMTYTRREMAGAIRLAWATGVRDTLTMMQDAPLSQEQADLLAQCVVEHAQLQPMIRSVLGQGYRVLIEDVLRGPQRAKARSSVTP